MPPVSRWERRQVFTIEDGVSAVQDTEAALQEPATYRMRLIAELNTIMAALTHRWAGVATEIHANSRLGLAFLGCH